MIELKDVHKSFQLGDSAVHAVRGISLTIEPGEFVAIMGPSGSGKSTLMHILGLLDVPDSGSYRLFGKEVARLNDDELAVLRREAVGFVFQQFNLLPRMTAAENVALPLLYSKRSSDLAPAQGLLQRVGLGDRMQHRPNELSGGQQQRVAIARSMVNAPQVILADEPTGNLDSASKDEIVEVLRALNAQGITVILVTHEEEIGRQADRRIRIRDGVVHSDERIAPKKNSASSTMKNFTNGGNPFSPTAILEHFKQGLRALAASKVRTALSILGILIGVAAVVAMLGLGQGARDAIEKQLSSLGSNLLVLHPGAVRMGGVAMETGAVTRLTLEDVTALKERFPAIRRVSPSVRGRAQLTYSDKNWNTQVYGAGPDYAAMRASAPTLGRFFDEEDNRKRSRVAVIGMTVVKQLFGGRNPVGEVMKVNRVIFQVIGVLPEKGGSGFRDQDDVVLIPVLTAMHRLFGKDYIDGIDIEVREASAIPAVQKGSVDLLLSRKRVPLSQRQDAFQVHNMADIQEALSSSSRIMSTLLASIAAISLLVGGIGIMNIMLVSVTERTREIGLRKAVGARKADILSQFLVESVVVSTLGGLAGILLGWTATVIMTKISGWATSVSLFSVVGAFLFSAVVGIVFGLYPARKASLLNPIDALRYE